MRTWTQPYSVRRLLRMIAGWTFHSDYDDLEESTGEPSLARADRRINEMLRERRDSRPARYDPINDEEQALFHVNDVAIILARLQELEHLEHQLLLAIGPACNTQQFNRKTGSSRTSVPRTLMGTESAMRLEFSPAVRTAALLRAHHRCERCGSKTSLELHHRGHSADRSLFNAEVLCSDCHGEEHQRRRCRLRC